MAVKAYFHYFEYDYTGKYSGYEIKLASAKWGAP
jgi:hypothetical protein